MQITPPALRRAVRDGLLTPDKADELAPYLEAAAPHQRLHDVVKISTQIGAWVGMALAAILTFAVAAGIITAIAVGLVAAWRFITGL